MNRFLRLAPALCLLCFVFPLYGGEVPAPGESSAGGELRFIQRLNWTALDSAGFYEVTVQRRVPFPEDSAKGGAEYTEVFQKRSAEPFIDCSLSPGQYRYQVRPYNVLGQAGPYSGWAYFTVQSPQGEYAQRFEWTAVAFAAFYTLVIEQRGKGVYQETLRVELRDKNFIEISLPPGEYRSQVISFDLLGRRGNASAWEYFTVLPPAHEKSKNTALFAGAGLSPLFPLPFSEFNRRYGTGLQPLGASLGLAFVPFGNPAGDPDKGRVSLGFALNPSWNYFSRRAGDYAASNQLASLHINLLWQIWLRRGSLALNMRFGGGLTLIWDLHISRSGYRENENFITWLNSAAADVSLQWFINENFFLDFGAGYVHVFSVDNPFLNFLGPRAGFGWRWN